MDRNAMARVWVCVGFCVVLSARPAAGQNPNVTVNEQPTAEQRVGEINALRQAGRFDAAAELVQEMIDQAQQKLVGVGDGRYTDAERWCREELLRDPALREAYRQRYSATAAHALEQAAEAGDPARALGDVYYHYTVTEPGYEAGLQLAGHLLERGEVVAASSLLNELSRHPDRATQLARWLVLRGAAAVYTQDAGLAEDARQQLIELGKADQAAWLKTLGEALGPAAIARRPGQIDAGPKPDELRVSLWDQAYAEAERSQTWLRDQMVMPVLTPGLALINNGRQVVALDRASGQRLWVYPPDDSSDVTRSIAGQRWYDSREVAVGSGAICAVLGECYGITESRNPYVPTNRLACIDEITGEVRWERESGDLNPDEPARGDERRLGRANFQYTHFVGTPIIARGQVLTLLRRANAQGSQTTWLLSYDLETGTLLWLRHLALSSLSYSSDAQRVYPQLSLHGETLYLTDSIATAAAIDIRDGGYRWLRVLPVGYGATRRLTIETDGTIAPPVLTRAGLLVPFALSQGRLVLLNPEDGSTLQTFENDPHIRSPLYLMDGGDGAVVVSMRSVAYWDADDAEVAWTFELGESERAVGRGDVTRQFVVVPTNSRVIVLDKATGKLLDQSDAIIGNVTVSDGELIAANGGRLYSYMSWQRAYQRLVERARELPGDPTAGLALASLALRQGGKTQAVMEGVGYALDAIDRQTPADATLTRQRVFEQLRSLALQTQVVDNTTRRLLYDRLALVTQTAAQEVAYHLDVGRFFAEMGLAQQAVEHFQAVIGEPAFASQAYERDGTTRSAGAVAQQEILALIETHGRSVYGRYDALARARLAELMADGQADAAALARIARRYPMSLAAVESLLEAGQRFEDDGQAIAAAGLYQQAIVRAGRSRQRQVAVGRLLSFYLRLGRPDDASALLDREARLHPDLYPIDADQPLTHSVWRSRISETTAAAISRHDLADAFATPILLPGRLVGPAPGIEPDGQTDHLLLAHGDDTLTCHRAENPEQPAWTAALPVKAQRWFVLADRKEQLLLWAPNSQTLLALDPAAGTTLWSMDLGLNVPKIGGVRLEELEDVNDFVFAVSDTVVCIGHKRSAAVVAIDRAAGGVLWRSQLDMVELAALDADQWTVVAVGSAGHHIRFSSGSVAFLSLFTGESVIETPDRRINMTPFAVTLRQGRALVIGENRVAAMDTVTGGEAWSRAFTDESLTGVYAASGALVVVETRDGLIHVLDAEQGGREVGRVLVRGGTDETVRTTIQPVGGLFWVRSRSGLYCLGTDPVLRWRDAVSLPYKQPYRVLIGKDRVAMLASIREEIDPDRIHPPDMPVSYALFLFDRDSGRLAREYMLGPFRDQVGGLMDPRGAQLFGQGFAVPAGKQTMVVPGKPAQP